MGCMCPAACVWSAQRMSIDHAGDQVKTIGHQMRAARKNAGLTIREVAAMVHAGESQISNWERGINTPAILAVTRYIDAGLLTRADAAAALLGVDAA